MEPILEDQGTKEFKRLELQKQSCAIDFLFICLNFGRLLGLDRSPMDSDAPAQ